MKTTDTRTALQAAINALVLQGKEAEARTLLMIMDHNCCHHLDTGPERTGQLTDAIDVMVFG